MRLVFHLLEEDEIRVANYLKGIMKKLKVKANLIEPDDGMDDETVQISFEEVLFLRIAFEFSKMYRKDRSSEYLDLLDEITPNFDDFYAIFNHLLKNPAMT